jgi:hypothetical protein
MIACRASKSSDGNDFSLFPLQTKTNCKISKRPRANDIDTILQAERKTAKQKQTAKQKVSTKNRSVVEKSILLQQFRTTTE